MKIPTVFAQWSDTGVSVKQIEDTAKKTTDLKLIIEQSGFFQTEIGEFVSKAVDAAIIFGSLLCLGYLMWGAVDWLTSEGDKEKYTSARQKIMHAIMGLGILVSVFAIWQILLHFFGLSAIFPGS